MYCQSQLSQALVARWAPSGSARTLSRRWLPGVPSPSSARLLSPTLVPRCAHSPSSARMLSHALVPGGDCPWVSRGNRLLKHTVAGECSPCQHHSVPRGVACLETARNQDEHVHRESAMSREMIVRSRDRNPRHLQCQARGSSRLRTPNGRRRRQAEEDRTSKECSGHPRSSRPVGMGARQSLVHSQGGGCRT